MSSGDITLPSNAEGINLLPEGLRGPNATDWLRQYTDRLDQSQAVILAWINALAQWDQEGAILPVGTLEIIGRLLGQPRPTGASDQVYQRILKVRRLVRQSNGTRLSVRRVTSAIAEGTQGATVTFVTPHTVIVTFANFAAVEARGFSLSVVASLLLDTIQDVDRLQIFDAVGNVFTWSVEGKGWIQAVWAVPLYDNF